MPLFDQDLEAASGKPEEAKRLKALFLSHQGLIIASPEYNSAYSAALKNAIDWVSRGDSPDEPVARCPSAPMPHRACWTPAMSLPPKVQRHLP